MVPSLARQMSLGRIDAVTAGQESDVNWPKSASLLNFAAIAPYHARELVIVLDESSSAPTWGLRPPQSWLNGPRGPLWS